MCRVLFFGSRSWWYLRHVPILVLKTPDHVSLLETLRVHCTYPGRINGLAHLVSRVDPPTGLPQRRIEDYWYGVIMLSTPHRPLTRRSGYVQEPPTNALSVLDGLHCMHLQLCLAAHNAFVIEWWTAAFQSLADSGATIHFTELTLTFTPHHHSPKLCDALFGVLSHDVFRGVQKIHF